MKQGKDEDFARCIQLLYEVHSKHPELRMCQILSIAAHKAKFLNNDLFYCPDSTVCEGLGLILEQ